MAAGAIPVTNVEVPELIWWVRHRDARGVDPSVALIALGQPSAAMTAFGLGAGQPGDVVGRRARQHHHDATGWFFLLRSSSVVAEARSVLDDRRCGMARPVGHDRYLQHVGYSPGRDQRAYAVLVRTDQRVVSWRGEG